MRANSKGYEAVFVKRNASDWRVLIIDFSVEHEMDAMRVAEELALLEGTDLVLLNRIAVTRIRIKRESESSAVGQLREDANEIASSSLEGEISKEGEKSKVPKLTYSVPEVCQALQISRTTLWKLIKSRRLKPIRIGRKLLFSLKAVEEFLDGKSSGK